MEIELEALGRVNFLSDGIQLTPRDVGLVLQHVAERQEIGIDEYCNGGLVEVLEKRFAQELGKPACLYLPTGTLANHLALRALSERGGRVFAQAEGHVYRDSGNALGILSQLSPIGLGVGQADFSLEDFEAALERNDEEKVALPASTLSIESPVRRFDGRCFDPSQLRSILGLARERGLSIHRDGARIHFDAAWNGVPVKDIAADYDTVYCSLHKAFNATSGAVLAGSPEVIEPLRHTRRMFGGAPAHAWPQAAVALFFLEGFEARMSLAVERSKQFFLAMESVPGLRVEPVPNGTHVTRLRWERKPSPSFYEQMASAGIQVPAADSDGVMSLRTNESILHCSLEHLVASFGAAAN